MNNVTLDLEDYLNEIFGELIEGEEDENDDIKRVLK